MKIKKIKRILHLIDEINKKPIEVVKPQRVEFPLNVNGEENPFTIAIPARGKLALPETMEICKMIMKIRGPEFLEECKKINAYAKSNLIQVVMSNKDPFNMMVFIQTVYGFIPMLINIPRGLCNDLVKIPKDSIVTKEEIQVEE